MARYSVGVNRDFIARHFLVGGDFGPEGELHSHHYRVEIVVEGERLDEHDFLVDIVRVKESVGHLVERFRESTLNELPELDGRNPGCEAFAEVFATGVRKTLEDAPGAPLSALTVKVWEDEEAWASCRLELG